MAVLKKWFRFRGLFRIYLYAFLMFCSLAAFIISAIFSEIESYQVRLAEEIKIEIDLAAHAPRQIPVLSAATKKLLFSSTTKKIEQNYWSLSEEEWRNALLFQVQNQSLSQRNDSRENTKQLASCIGKTAPQEFVFHKISKGIAFIYSAFWDSRWNDFDNKDNSTFIRLFGVARARQENGGWKRPPLSCLFYIRGAYHIIPAQEYQMSEGHLQKYRGFIYSCKVPVAVKSIVCSVLVASGETADPSWATRIPVWDIQPQDERFSIIQCVPPLFGDSITEQRFLQFMEMSKLLGSEHVIIYSMNPGNLSQILDYYKRTGFATVIQWPLPQMLASELWSFGQLIAVQDCLYRGMAISDLIAFNDVDEHIIPRAHKTWTGLINAIDRSNEHIGYVFHSTFFEEAHKQLPDQVKQFKSLEIVTNTKRINMTSNLRHKLIVRPTEIFEKGIHHISKPLDAQMAAVEINEEVALLHHYRKCDTHYGQKCKAWFNDVRAWGYAPELYKRVLFTEKWMGRLVS